ncbi:MAG: 2-iminoacetate synthase ThiH, partial [Odoribacter sp.]
ISISTRENATFRDQMLPLGITSLSAGSKTEPGGYYTYPQALEQFHISDERTPEEVTASARRQGYEPVWKDWDGWM